MNEQTNKNSYMLHINTYIQHSFYEKNLGLMLSPQVPKAPLLFYSVIPPCLVGDLTPGDQSLRERLITHTDEAELPSRWLSASVSA